MKVTTIEELQYESINLSGADLIITTCGGNKIFILDGLAKMIENNAQFCLHNGSVVTYKDMLQMPLTDEAKKVVSQLPHLPNWHSKECA